MHALSLYPFFLICCSLSIPISIPIFEHRSTLLLSLIHTILVTSTDPQLRSGKTRSSIDLPSSYPQAPIRFDQIRSDRDLPRFDPQASIRFEISPAPIRLWLGKTHTHELRSSKTHELWSFQSSTDLSLCCLSVWVCLCVGVFVYLCFFFFFEQVYLCVDVFVCGCVCVHLRKKKKMRRWEVTKFVEHGEEREKKRSERAINKIINRRATVTVYIYTVTIAHVEIYTFLYTFRSTDVEQFWGKMCKSGVFFYFTWFCIHWCGCSKINVDLPESAKTCFKKKIFKFTFVLG